MPGGFQKIIQIDSATAHVPLLRLSEPGFKNRLAQVSSATFVAYPFRPPGAVVRNLMGSFPFTDDSVWWHGVYAQMPQSKVGGDGSYVFNTVSDDGSALWLDGTQIVGNDGTHTIRTITSTA